jgi:hypothetical protein
MSLAKTSRGLKRKSNDIVFTPLPVAKKMIEMCDITPDMTVLDPCYGKGVFYENLPECKKEFCEITMEKDFFDETRRFDLIIGNPPYSLWNKWIDHTMELTDKFCFIFGNMNLTDSRLRHIFDAGYGITHFHLLKIEFWFSTSYLVVFEKNKPSIITVQSSHIVCDICNSSCRRGRKPNGMNECSKTEKTDIS